MWSVGHYGGAEQVQAKGTVRERSNSCGKRGNQEAGEGNGAIEWHEAPVAALLEAMYALRSGAAQRSDLSFRVGPARTR